VSLSDTFASEKIYSFTVQVNQISQELIIHESDNQEGSSVGSAKSGANSSSNSKDKKKVETKGKIKILKVNRNSIAEIRIWPSS
jgi:hypothetical protein